jgi:hypothetical protein
VVRLPAFAMRARARADRASSPKRVVRAASKAVSRNVRSSPRNASVILLRTLTQRASGVDGRFSVD